MLLVTGGALTAFYQGAAIDQFQTGVYDVAEGLYSGTSVKKTGEVMPPANTDVRSTRAFSGRYWQIAEPTPKGISALVRSRSLFDQVLPPPPGGVEALATQLGHPIYYDVAGPEKTHLRAVALMSLVQNRTEPLIFMAAQDRGPVDKSVRDFGESTAFFLVALGLGLVLAVFLQVRLGLRPLFSLGHEIADVRKGKVARLSEAYPVEIAPLAHEMNALLAHNQEVVERQRTHVGNLAHALKTPLAVITSEAEHKSDNLPDVVTRQASVMQGQIDHHLRRARAAARAQNLGERTAVEPALDELARMLERVFQDKGVVIDWTAPPDLMFRGERQDLLEIAGNVLENACKWCRKTVEVEATLIGPGRLRLSVDDDGPGLPDEQRDTVMKRGARLDESAPGSGLGLSIVDELARAYGGTVVMDRSALGGLKVQIDLPAAES
ncbi:MAG TPA: ATP-binding protein [Caulobacteraceae bacterium]